MKQEIIPEVVAARLPITKGLTKLPSASLNSAEKIFPALYVPVVKLTCIESPLQKGLPETALVNIEISGVYSQKS
jgi:hypothetical protein